MTTLSLEQEIFDEIVEVEKHFHNREIWVGKLAVQTATEWADDTLSPYQAISGNNDYGSDANDEAQVLGTADTPITAGKVKFDFARIEVISLSSDTPYKLRIAWGTGTLAEALAANQCSELIVQNVVAGSKSNGAPVDVKMPRLNCGSDKVWIQAWNATDNATADFLVGVHEYDK